MLLRDSLYSLLDAKAEAHRVARTRFIPRGYRVVEEISGKDYWTVVVARGSYERGRGSDVKHITVKGTNLWTPGQA